MSFLYRYVSPDCQDLKSFYKNVQHSLVLDISNVQMMFHKTSLWTLFNATSFIIEKYNFTSVLCRLLTLYFARCNINLDSIKPVVKKSKSALKRLRNWEPFKVPENISHTFFNFSARIHRFNSMMCDSDQEFLSFSFTQFEFDSIVKPKSKIVMRSFVKDILVEDMTQFTLFPKVDID